MNWFWPVFSTSEQRVREFQPAPVTDSRLMKSFMSLPIHTIELHLLRHPISTRYLAREFIAYFKGNLNPNSDFGLVWASKVWQSLTDKNGLVNSNYGYSVFHEKTPTDTSQYAWVLDVLRQNPQSRRAIININSVHHKYDSPDFPCAVSLQFYIVNNRLHCSVTARSTDVVWGLPYDIGFFSFLNEMICVDLMTTCPNLTLGSTMIRSNFTQIYDHTRKIAEDILEFAYNTAYGDAKMPHVVMPQITDAQALLDDISFDSKNTKLLQWLWEQAFCE